MGTGTFVSSIRHTISLDIDNVTTSMSGQQGWWELCITHLMPSTTEKQPGLLRLKRLPHRSSFPPCLIRNHVRHSTKIHPADATSPDPCTTRIGDSITYSITYSITFSLLADSRRPPHCQKLIAI